jgi:hypothetical protein
MKTDTGTLNCFAGQERSAPAFWTWPYRKDNAGPFLVYFTCGYLTRYNFTAGPGRFANLQVKQHPSIPDNLMKSRRPDMTLKEGIFT